MRSDQTSLEILEREMRNNGWNERMSAYPNIQDQVALARRGKAFLLLFRGQEESPPRREDLFVIGQKSCPAYYDGNTEQLQFNFRDIAAKENMFRRLADEFAASPMCQEDVRAEDLLQRYRLASFEGRGRLGQVLVYGLQYQICRPGVRKWRKYLFVISCSTEEDVAIKYALRNLPTTAYVLEYAPPFGEGLFRRVSEVLNEFQGLGIERAYPDRDREVFVHYGMLPHYLLGYSVLQRSRTEGIYETTYVPNPWYAERRKTLLDPPDLTMIQMPLIEATHNEIAWIFHHGGNYRTIRHADGMDNIGSTVEG
jgi:hypothetical protein